MGRAEVQLEHIVDRLQPPQRDITSPLRFPISNVFKGQGSTTGVWGRVCSGLVQVGERLRMLPGPGDETAVVKGPSYLFTPSISAHEPRWQLSRRKRIGYSGRLLDLTSRCI